MTTRTGRTLNSRTSSKGAKPGGASRTNKEGAVEASRRVARVEREVHQVVSEFIIRNLRDELPGLVTVGRVLIPGDLRSAKVFVSLLDPSLSKQKEAMEEVLDLLNDMAGEIQHQIGKKIQTKYLPKLQFLEDTSTDRILKVESLLSQLVKPK